MGAFGQSYSGGQQSAVSGQRSAVSGQQLAVSGQRSLDFRQFRFLGQIRSRPIAVPMLALAIEIAATKAKSAVANSDFVKGEPATAGFVLLAAVSTARIQRP
jgi:hypothetical protein